jgi:hypothetical protein
VAGLTCAINDDAGGAEFSASPFGMTLLILAGLLMTACCAVLAFKLIPGYEPTRPLIREISFFGFFVFGVSLLGSIQNALTLRGVVVSVNSRGILDRRISETLIPWSAIEKVSFRRLMWRTLIHIHLEPTFKSTLPVRFDAVIYNFFNRLLGYSGYEIRRQGLSGPATALIEAMSNWEFYKTGRRS